MHLLTDWFLQNVLRLSTRLIIKGLTSSPVILHLTEIVQQLSGPTDPPSNETVKLHAGSSFSDPEEHDIPPVVVREVSHEKGVHIEWVKDVWRNVLSSVYHSFNSCFLSSLFSSFLPTFLLISFFLFVFT